MNRAPEQNIGDKFACMRSFFESFNKNISKFHYPSSYLAVNKTLYPYRGRIGFKQYNPSKPAKYGLLYRSLCDATIFTLTFPCLTLLSRKFSKKKIQQKATMLLEMMSTLSTLSMAFPLLPTCLGATSLWIDILLLSH